MKCSNALPKDSSMVDPPNHLSLHTSMTLEQVSYINIWLLMQHVCKPLMVASKPLLQIQPVAVQFQDAMYASDQAVHPMLSGLEQHARQLGHQPEWGKNQADEISMLHSDLYTTNPHEEMLPGCAE